MFFSILSKKQFCGIALFFVLLSVASPSLFAQTFTQDGLSYAVTNTTTRTVRVSAASGFSNTVVTIPDSVEYNSQKYAVTEIAANGFRGLPTLKEVHLEGAYHLINIGSNAFMQSTNLSGNITIPAKVEKIESNCFYQTAITGLAFAEGSQLTTMGTSVFYQCKQLTGTITIPSKLTSINTWCFQETAITGLVIPDDSELTFIGSNAFYKCANLAGTITIPAKVTNLYSSCFSESAITGLTFAEGSQLSLIDNSAFYLCKNLGGVIDLPATVTKIGSSCFRLSAITGLNIPATSELSAIGSDAFRECEKLSGTIYIPAKVEKIDNYCFYKTAITGLTFAEGSQLTTLGVQTFNQCKQLTGTITIPSKLTSIPSACFQETAITGLVIPDDSELTSIGASAFYKCANLAGTITIPAGVMTLGNSCFEQTAITNLSFAENSQLQTIGTSAFYLCANLGGTIHIPATVTTLGAHCLRKTAITGVVFPENSELTTIGQEAFRDLLNFQVNDTLVLPSTLTNIHWGAFYNSQNIKAIKLTSPSAPILGTNNIPNKNSYVFYNSTCPIIVADGTYFDYTEDKGWELAYRLRLYDGIDRTIERNNVLYYPISDTTLKVIGCTDGYTGVVAIKDTIQQWGKTFVPAEIAAYAFQNAAISGLEVGNSNLQYIRQYAFDGCTQLDGIVEFPSSLKIIERYAFNNTILKGVAFEEGLEKINDSAFRNCNSISGVISFPSSLTIIEGSAFLNNYSITGVVFQEGITTIGNWAFQSCSNIAGTIVFPASLQNLGYSSFAYNYMLQHVIFTPNEQEGVLKIQGAAFYSCNKLNGNLVIPSSVKLIGESAFYNCGEFSSIQLPASGLDSISNYAFGRSTLSTKSAGVVRIPASVTGIGQNAFFNLLLDSLVIAQRPAPPTLNPNGGMFVGADYPIYIPRGTFYTYCSAPGWSVYASRLNDGLISAFVQDGVKYVAISDSTVQVIGCTDQLAGTLHLPRQAKDLRNGKTYTVTEIGAEAFKGNSTIDKLILEDCDSLQTIGQYAFDGSVILSDTIVFPASLKSIGKYAFNNCKKLQGVKFQEGLEYIYDYAFYNCTILGGRLLFPSSLKIINANAFRYTAIEQVTFPQTGDLAIKSEAFRDCNKLSGVLDIPASIIELGSSAFWNSTAIEGVNFARDSRLTSIGNSAFYNCIKLSGVIDIPSSVTAIGASAFNYCGQITMIRLPEGIKTIAHDAFVRRPEYAKDTVDTLIIPSTVTWIEYNAFKEQNFKYIKVLGTTPPILYAHTTLKISDMFYGSTCKIRIPDGLYDTYCDAKYGWEIYARRLDDGVVREFTYDHVIYIPMTDSTVMVAGLESDYVGAIHIPDSVAYDEKKYAVVQIMQNAFFQNKKITGVTIDYGLQSIEQYAFYECTNLGGQLVLPASLKKVGEYAFYGCTALHGGLTIPESLTTIGRYAFYNCTNLDGDIVLPMSLIRIEPYTFYNAAKARSLVFAPNSKLNYIGDYAFSYCGFMGTLDIPESVGEICAAAFWNDTNIVSVQFNGTNLRYIRSSAFSECKKLKGTIDIPSSVLYIDGSAFYNCPFSEIIMREGLLSIGDHAFRRSTKASYLKDSVEAVVIPKTTTYIGQYAFADLNLKDITLLNPEPARVSTNGRMFDGSQCPIHIPAGSYFAYANADVWKNYKLRLTDGVVEEQTVGNLRIMPMSETTAQVLGLADNTFREALIIPASASLSISGQDYTFQLTSIADSAFKATNIVGLAFEEGSQIQEIGAYAFAGCKQLADTVKLPDALRTIGMYAFDGNLNINYVVFREGLKTIGNYAFSNCAALQGVIQIPASVVEIGAAAFYRDINIRGVAFAENSKLEYIRSSAFQECKNLKGEIAIPAKVKTIDGNAFYACGDISSIRFLGNNITSIGGSAFQRNTVTETVLDTLFLPSSLSTMGSNVFYNQKFRQVVIGARVPPTIGTNVFYGDTCRIVIPQGTRFVYMDTQGWSAYPERLYDGTDGAVSYDGIIRIAPINSTEAAVVGLVKSQYDSVVVIPDSALLTIGEITRKFKVVSIQQNAFRGSRISGLTINNGIETIEPYAFAECVLLQSDVVIPASVKTIGNYAFWKSGITSLRLNEGLTTIGTCAFEQSAIHGVLIIPNSVTTIYNNAFSSCYYLTEITLSENVSVLNNSVFYNCNRVTKLTLPEGKLTSIGSSTFNSCKALQSVVIPKSVTILNSSAFANCSALTDLTLQGDKLTTIGNSAFYRCSSLSAVSIPQSVSKIDAYAFYECKNLATLTIPEDSRLQTIGDYGFYECTSLTAIPLPAGLQTIGTEAFSCKATNNLVTNLVIPDKVSSIGANAFFNRNFQTIHVKGGAEASGTYPPKLDSKGGMFDGSTCVINIPEGQYERYCESTYGWGAYADRLDDGSMREFDADGLRYVPIDRTSVVVVGTVGQPATITIPATVTFKNNTYNITTIGKNAFRDSTFITSVQFAEGSRLDSIADYAFYGCKNIEGTLHLPASVRVVGNGAFQGCSGLTKLRIHEGVQRIGSYAFYKCTALSDTIALPATVRTVDDYAFSEDKLITRLFFAEGSQLQKIGNYAFNQCMALADSIIIPNSVEMIGNYAFYNTAIDSLYLGTGNLRTIGSRAFSNCKQLAGEIRVPNTVETIGTYAFELTLLRRAALPENAKFLTVPEGMFNSCSQLIEMAIPESVTAINRRAFYDCHRLRSFIFSERSLLQTIGDEVFCCVNKVDTLQTIYIPRTVQTIGKQVFYNRRFAHMELYNPMPATIGTNVFDGADATFNYTIYIPRNSYFDYSEASAWTAYAKRLNDGTNYVHEVGRLLVAALSRTEAQVAGFVPEKEFEPQLLQIPSTIKLPKHEVGAAETDSTWYDVVEIAEGAFQNEQRITTLTIGDKVRTIGANAFYGCLATDGVLTIPASVKNIGSAAFQKTAFSSLQFAAVAQIKTINSYAFAECRRLTGTLTLPPSVEDVGTYAFQKDSLLTGLQLSENLKTIQQNAFDSCCHLTTLTIPASVKKIGNYAFYECVGLTSIDIEKGDLTAIETGAFETKKTKNINVPEIVIPANVLSISGNAFNNRWFNTITMRSKTPCILGNNVFNYGEGSIYVPAGTYWKYTTADIWQTYKKTNGEFRITDGIYNIEHTVANLVVKNTSDTTAYVLRVDKAFDGQELLIPHVVTLTESVGGTSADYAIDSIAKGAFSYNNTITTVVFDSIVPPRTSGKDANLFSATVTSLKLPCGSFDNYRNDAYFGNWAGGDWMQKFITRCEPLEIYHHTHPSDEVTKVFTDPYTGQITYKRTFKAGMWEPLYLPFEIESMTADDVNINIVCHRNAEGQVTHDGYFYLGFIDAWGNLDFVYNDVSAIQPNTPYIIYFPRFEGDLVYDDYWSHTEVTFTSKHTEHKVLLEQPNTTRISQDQLIGNLTMQPQTIQGPFYTLVQDTKNDFVLQKEGTAVLQPFECYVVPKEYPVNVAMPTMLRAPRFGRPSTPTDVVPVIEEEMLTYYYDGGILHIANHGHPVAVYSLTGQLLQTIPAGKAEALLPLERGCYIISSEGLSQKIAF